MYNIKNQAFGLSICVYVSQHDMSDISEANPLKMELEPVQKIMMLEAFLGYRWYLDLSQSSSGIKQWLKAYVSQTIAGFYLY